MAELLVSGYDSPEYDSCGNTCVAIIDVHNIRIPLCRECLDELIQSVDTFKNTVFCHKCEHFRMSEEGWRYGGSCLLKASKEGKTLNPESYGYDFCVGCMDTCNEAKLIQDENK